MRSDATRGSFQIYVHVYERSDKRVHGSEIYVGIIYGEAMLQPGANKKCYLIVFEMIPVLSPPVAILPGPVRDTSRKHSDADARKRFNSMGGDSAAHVLPAPTHRPGLLRLAERGEMHRSRRSKSPLPPDTGSLHSGLPPQATLESHGHRNRPLTHGKYHARQ